MKKGENSNGLAQILLKCLLQGKMGQKIAKLFGVATLLFILGFGGYAYAINKNENNINNGPRRGDLFLAQSIVTALFDMERRETVELGFLSNDFNGDGVDENIKFLGIRYKDEEGVDYGAGALSPEDSFYEIDGVFSSAEAIDLNKDGINELALTAVKDKMYNMIILNYGKDGVLRPFPVFDEKDDYFGGIWSKFEIALEDTDVVNALPKIVARLPEYIGDYCGWKNIVKYYKWNGIGFEHYKNDKEALFPQDYCEN